MSDAPAEIWVGVESWWDFESVFARLGRYVRGDLYEALEAENAELRRKLAGSYDTP